MIELDNVSGGYHGEERLNGVSLSFPAGQITALVGPNGSGKSTLVKTAAGLLAPFAGSVRLEGKDIFRMPRGELAKRVSYLPQTRNTPSISAKALVMHGRFPYLGYPRRYGKRDHEIARSAMERVGILDLADRDLPELSGGERQKVYIAMIIAQDTDVVFLDEPTTYLDILHQLEIMEIARQLKDEGKTVAVVLHDLNLALCHADFIAVIASGRLLRFDRPDGVFQSGALNRAFGVSVLRQDTGTLGVQYFFGLMGG